MIRSVAAVLIFLAAAIPAVADDKHHQPGAAASAPAEGEVRKVDKAAKKITIKHGPLEALDMPAMTMVFQVRDPAMLERVKAGDRVTFSVEKLGGALTVTKIEKAK